MKQETTLKAFIVVYLQVQVVETEVTVAVLQYKPPMFFQAINFLK